MRVQELVFPYPKPKIRRFLLRCEAIPFYSRSVFGKPERLFIMSGEEEEGTSSLVANLDMTIPSVTLPHGSAKFSSVHGFLACFELSKFIICNPSTGQVITFHCKAPGTSLGYDPVDDQFKALTQVTSIYDHNPSSMVHEVITLGRGGVVSRTQVTSPPHHPLTMGRCINGFIYYAAWAPVYGATPVFVCFDVRHERILSFITTPKDVLLRGAFTLLIEYKGKLAVVVPNCFRFGLSFNRFYLWMRRNMSGPNKHLSFPCLFPSLLRRVSV
ncbi:hypothetical protein Bca4012_087949 [Brassica carinata]